MTILSSKANTFCWQSAWNHWNAKSWFHFRPYSSHKFHEENESLQKALYRPPEQTTARIKTSIIMADSESTWPMYTVKGKGKGVHMHAIKAYSGNRCIAPTSNFVTRRGRVPGTHWPGGWVDSKASLNILGTEHLPLPAIELQSLDYPAYCPLTTPAMLSWLQYRV